MGKDQLAVFRGHPRQSPPRSQNAPTSTRTGDDDVVHHPLTILGLAASIRLDDPRQEHERVVMLEVAIVAGREAARALDRWLSQSLTEYRGSRSAWDLTATTGELRLKLDQFELVLSETAERLVTLIPGLRSQVPGAPPRLRRTLEEVAVVSRLFKVISREATSEPNDQDSSVVTR